MSEETEPEPAEPNRDEQWNGDNEQADGDGKAVGAPSGRSRSADDAPTGDSGLAERKRRMGAGMRSRLRRWARATGAGVRRATPVTIMGVLAVGSFATLLGPQVGWEVLAAVGGNVLTDVVKGAVERIRPGASREQTLDAVQQRIVATLAEGGERAAALRADIARLLKEVGGIDELLREVLAEQEDLRWELIEGLTSLSEEFDEFRFLLWEILRAVQDSDDRDTARHEQLLDRLHRLELQGYQVQLAVEAGPRRAPSERPPSPYPPWRGERPYRGLAAFQQGDAGLFHGRAQATAELLGIVARAVEPGALGMVMVTGASGVGKSSLLRAGLLPALAAGTPVAAARWPRIVLTPKQYGSPLRGLAVELAALAEKSNQRALLEQLTAEPGGAGFLVAEAVLAEARRSPAGHLVGEDRRLVLVVDQFEQLFGTDGPGEAEAFVAALHAAAVPLPDGGVPPALVVLGMRGDQLDHCAQYAVLRRVQQENQFVLGPMEEADLRRAIVGQATAAGLRVEDGLVPMVLDELRSRELADFGAGTLPLVAQAMLLTWEKREEGWLTCRGYELSGGVRRAVENSAEEVFGELEPEERDVATQALRQMMFVGGDGQPVSRRVALESLPASALPILRRFEEKRLLVIGDGAVEPAHHVLLKAWSRLRRWFEADSEEWKLYGRVVDDAARWARSTASSGSGFLYTGRRLETVRSAERRWAANPGRFPVLEAQQREFLEASAAADRRRRVVLSSIAALVVMALVAIVGAAVVSGRSRAELTGELSRRLAASSAREEDPVVAALLAAAAWRVSPTDEARYGLRAVLAGRHRGTLTVPLGSVEAVAVSRDGRMLATASRDSLIRLWDLSTHRPIGRPLALHAGPVTAVAFGADGRTVVSAGEDRTVQVWDLERGRRAAPITVPGTGPIVLGPDGARFFTGTQLWDLGLRRPLGPPLEVEASGAVFGPDGRMMATSDSEGGVRIWDTYLNHQFGPVLTGAVRPLAFSRDGKLLLTTTGTERLRLWDVASGEALGDRRGCAAGGAARVAAFRADYVIAVGCAGGAVKLWTVSGRALFEVDGHDGPVAAVAFSPDGTTLVGAAGGHVRLWDVREPLLTFVGDRNTPVAVDRSGRRLATAAGRDGNEGVLLWDLVTGRTVALGGHGAWPGELVFSPDGRSLAAGGDGRVQLWDVASGEARGVLGDAGPVHSLAYSADGRSLVTASGGAGFTVRWWEMPGGRVLRTLTPKVPPSENLPAFGHLTLSPDLRVLASVQDGQSLRLWDLADGRPLGEPMGGHAGTIRAIAFSRDGRLVATADSDGVLRLWDTRTRRPVGEPWTGHTAEVVAVAFSEDGRTLASGGRDRTVRLWDVATRRQLGAPLTGPFEYAAGLTFLPGRGTLAAAEDTGTLDLWQVGEPPDPLAAVCATAGRAMTREEWKRYAPGADFQTVCGDQAPAVFPSAKDVHRPLPVITPKPTGSATVPATAARFAGRYTLVLDNDETRAAFRREAPAQTYPLQQDLENTAARHRGDHPIALEATCPERSCALRLTGFAYTPSLTLSPTRNGTFRASVGPRTWTLHATTLTADRVTTFTLTYKITDPTHTYTGALGFRGARP
ncbi:AAA family ATPase [Sphaerisporangium sp. NPDC005288]|uniref:nSTAND1 domain-containing NTPase n=1 Tax=Sphaerisporangium sp. NPDC005288 TaxID=3155114 RepID=UPI0033ADA91A